MSRRNPCAGGSSRLRRNAISPPRPPRAPPDGSGTLAHTRERFGRERRSAARIRRNARAAERACKKHFPCDSARIRRNGRLEAKSRPGRRRQAPRRSTRIRRNARAHRFTHARERFSSKAMISEAFRLAPIPLARAYEGTLGLRAARIRGNAFSSGFTHTKERFHCKLLIPRVLRLAWPVSCYA